MKGKNSNLHGNAPDNSRVALLLIDVINDFEFEGGAQLVRHALPAAKRIAALKHLRRRAQERDRTRPRAQAAFEREAEAWDRFDGH